MKRRGNIILYPVSVLYSVITGFRNYLYNSGILKSLEFNIPVICVGNITVGGTGKTPHCEYLIRLLQGKYKVALLSRGYRRKTSGFLLAGRESAVSDIGDEPLQICRKFPDIKVAVDNDRVNGIRSLLRQHPETEIIILDDAYQHRSVKPGLSILLTDCSRLFIHDHMLPYGDLRERPRNMSRADIILVTKTPDDIPAAYRNGIMGDIGKSPSQYLYFTSLSYLDPVPVFQGQEMGKNTPGKDDPGNCSALLVTGIAQPEMLKVHIGKFAGEVRHLSFPDHHKFTATDIKAIKAAYRNLTKAIKYIFTTEKDATRLTEFSGLSEHERSTMFYIPVIVTFLNKDGNEFDNLILDYAGKNKRDSRVP